MSETSRPAIAFDKVSKAFGNKRALNELSLDVGLGETVCVLGRSGTGKSVTLKLMIGLLEPDCGAIYIQDRNIVGLNENGLSEVRREMGFLFQGAALFDSFSLNDNLALPLRRIKNLSKNDADACARAKLEEVGLGNDGAKMPAELSGGMQKRAGLARALVLEPKILLVDEPSSGLDRITSSEVDNLLLKLKERNKTTMVIVTHDITGARRVGDRFAVLDDGCLLAIGKPQDLEQSENELVRGLVSERK